MREPVVGGALLDLISLVFEISERETNIEKFKCTRCFPRDQRLRASKILEAFMLAEAIIHLILFTLYRLDQLFQYNRRSKDLHKPSVWQTASSTSNFLAEDKILEPSSTCELITS
jgi:hypothetical protein